MCHGRTSRCAAHWAAAFQSCSAAHHRSYGAIAWSPCRRGGQAIMVFEAGLGARPDELAGSHAGQASFPITTKVGTISFTSPRPDRGEHAGRARAGPDFRNCVGDHPRHADFHIASIYQQIDAARARAASDPQLSGAPNQAFSWAMRAERRLATCSGMTLSRLMTVTRRAASNRGSGCRQVPFQIRVQVRRHRSRCR